MSDLARLESLANAVATSGNAKLHMAAMTEAECELCAECSPETILALCAQLRQARVEWQPIATASKDGPPMTRLFLVSTECGTWMAVAYQRGDDWIEGAPHDPRPLDFTPTHWQPLPTPPGGEK